MNKSIGSRTKRTNRRVWKLRIIQHLTRRGTCWESIPNIARCLRIGKKRVTRYLEELRAAGAIKTTYRVRATQIHEVRWSKQIVFPSRIDDAGFTPKQANALTALFSYNEIAMKDIAKKTLCSANTARRAVWKAARLGFLKITEQPGFVHYFSWTAKVIRCLGRRAPKRYRRPLSKLAPVKHVVTRKHPVGENLRTSCGKTTSFSELTDEEKQEIKERWRKAKEKLGF